MERETIFSFRNAWIVFLDFSESPSKYVYNSLNFFGVITFAVHCEIRSDLSVGRGMPERRMAYCWIRHRSSRD